MTVDYLQYALWAVTIVGQYVGQYVITKGPEKIIDKAFDTILEKIFNTFKAKLPKDEKLIQEFENDPTDKQRQAKLVESLAKTVSTDPEFQRELTGLVEEIMRRIELDKVPPQTVLHQLPPDIACFTGRKEELSLLLEKAGQTGTAQTVLVLTGLGGTGKSALAIHAAHLLKDKFPDAQLYVDLRGADPEPMSPLTVLAGFLLALGYDESTIPMDLEDRAVKFRSALANRKALVLLDNAWDETQVRPLLPAGPNCVVLITSRRSLGNLQEAVLTMSLTTLTEQDARALLAHWIGQEKVSAEPEAVGRIVHLCGRLPLAIRIAGGQYKLRGFELGEYASRLEQEHERLKILKLKDLDVRASFMMSYQSLSPHEAHLFRLLGLLKGESFSSDVAVALEGREKEDVCTSLDGLVDAQLIGQPDQSRYGMHDLVRLLAMECLEQAKDGGQEAARLRLARWYVQASRLMSELLQPEKRAAKFAKLTGESKQSFEELSWADLRKALTWFELERANLLATVEWAYQSREWELTWQLAINLEPFYNLHCHWVDWRRTHVLAWRASRMKKNKGAEGILRNLLGNLYRLQGCWERAAFMFKTALELHRRLQNSIGESIAINLLANVYRLQGRWDEAIKTFEQGLELNRRSKNRFGEGIALGGLGNVYRMQGRWEEALQAYDESLKIARELHDPHGESITLNNIALVYSRQRRLEEAETTLTESLLICVKLGNPKGEGIARREFGEVYMLQHRCAEALEQLTKSLEIANKQHDPRCISQALNSLGEWHTQQGHWQEAGKCFEDERPILRSMKDRHDEGLALRSMGRLLVAQNRYKEATTIHQEALEMLNPSSPEYRDVKAWLQKPGLNKKLGGIISQIKNRSHKTVKE